MITRRQLFVVGAAAAGLMPVIAYMNSPSSDGEGAGAVRFPVHRTENEWRELLTPEQHRVLRGRGTERPFSSALTSEHRRGTFRCAACGHPLFDSDTKFESGTGWPSFWRAREDAVATSIDRSWLMVRTEVHCARCGSHLGHLFEDGPPPTGLRYCMNGVAMVFEPVA